MLPKKDKFFLPILIGAAILMAICIFIILFGKHE